MPSYREELEWIENDSEARDDPEGEDDHGIDDDLVRVRVGGRGIAWYARHIVRGPESKIDSAPDQLSAIADTWTTELACSWVGATGLMWWCTAGGATGGRGT